jgi:DNA-binding transcriptional regulator YiaG
MPTYRFNGAKLQEARLRTGMSAERLALILNPSPHTVEAYESGQAQPSRAALVRIAAAVQIEPADLLVADDGTGGNHVA